MLAVEEARLARAVEKLHLKQTDLDDKQTEIDLVRTSYNEAMQRRQASNFLPTLKDNSHQIVTGL